MRHLKGNLLSDDHGTGQPVGFFLSAVLVLAVFLGSFGVGRLTRSAAADFALDQLADVPILGQMRHLISSPDRKLAGEADDRINILLLGMGGEGHEAPNLTDTIIVASIKPSTRQVALLSIPRDLLVPLPKEGWRKINSVNAFGEVSAKGRGGDHARTVIEGLLGIDIPYYVRVDFEGFREAIDGVGGIDVHVDRTFTDAQYPTLDFKTQTVRFEAGWQKMDGETALRFARSRHGNNGEGSDFARAARQQKVLDALKEKLLSSRTYRSPATIANTLAALRSNITTNLQIGELVRLARMAQAGEPFRVFHKVLDNTPGSLLVDGNYGGAYVLLPRGDDWGALRSLAEGIFTEAVPADPPETPKPDASATAAVPATKAKVEVRNGTGTSGLARTVASSLSKKGFEVVKIGNADSFTHDRTTIYDLTKGARKSELETLKGALIGSSVTTRLPSSIDATEVKADFLVILGGEVAVTGN